LKGFQKNGLLDNEQILLFLLNKNKREAKISK
jgi:hypothetical protein